MKPVDPSRRPRFRHRESLANEADYIPTVSQQWTWLGATDAGCAIVSVVWTVMIGRHSADCGWSQVEGAGEPGWHFHRPRSGLAAVMQARRVRLQALVGVTVCAVRWITLSLPLPTGTRDEVREQHIYAASRDLSSWSHQVSTGAVRTLSIPVCITCRTCAPGLILAMTTG